MNYRNMVQNARKKFLQQKQLSFAEKEILEKDFKGKDYAYYKSIKDTKMHLPGQYSADATYRKIEQRIRPEAVQKGVSKLRPLLKYAAAITLLIIAAFGIYHLNNTPETIFLSTSYGERKQVTLPDGSIVILNSLSSVSYPENIHNSRTREIVLKGEAVFNVTKDIQRTFIVKVSEVEIKVLGTKFNVSAYENDENITTSLYEGAVSISSNSGEARQLKPGEQVMYNKKSNQMELLSTIDENHSAWTRGNLCFENIPLKDIFKILEREKDISFNISDEINKDLKLTAKFNHNESVEEMLEYLSQSGDFTFEKKEKTYYINKQKH